MSRASIERPVNAPQGVAVAVRRRLFVALAVAGVVALASALIWSSRLRNENADDPLARYSFTKLTEFEGAEEQAGISRDGGYVAFLRERDGVRDVWLSRIDSGDFRKLTDGTLPELRNPAVRTLGFSPDGSRVMIWTKTKEPGGGFVDAGWAIPVLGGTLQPMFRGVSVSELDWSPDGKHIVYHTAAAGDPTLVASADDRGDDRQIYVGPPGVHAHFPLWSRNGEFIFFVRGIVPNEMDIWRIRPDGGDPEQLTFHNARVLYPAQLDDDTLLYLATAEDGSGPWMHALDLERRVSRRLDTKGQAYTSLAASADGARLVATAVQTNASLWRVRVDTRPVDLTSAMRLDIDTPRALSPRIGSGFLVYRAPRAGIDGLWVFADGHATELWVGTEGRVVAGVAVSPDGRRVAFPVQRGEHVQLYIMNVDGTGVEKLADELDVRGAPAWSPNGQWIATGAMRDGRPRLFKIPIGGGAPVALGTEYAVDPVWSPSGDFVVFSSADVGSNVALGAVTADGASHVLPPLVLSRGARRLDFLGDGQLVVLKGDLSHKELWAIDLETGAERQLTAFGPGPMIVDFDVSPDGSEIVLDRVTEETDIVLIDRVGD